MKGVVLAGGLGTRLYPLTFVTNKHLLPVFDKPMIFYPIQTLVEAGIREILIVVGGPHSGHFLSVLRNSKKLGVKHLEFAYQEKEGGIAEALSLAEDFANGESVTVILGDNTTDENIKNAVDNFSEGAVVFLKKVSDPERFGVPTFDKKDSSKIIKITEKPKNPDSNFAVTGLYIYDNHVFEYIRKLKRSNRGELEVTDLNNIYIEKNKLYSRELKGFWRDAGTFDTLLEVGNYWAKRKRV